MNKLSQNIINAFNVQRKGSEDLVILEGLHAVKHAIRFGAKFEDIYLFDEYKTLDIAKKFLVEREFLFLKNKHILITEKCFSKIAPNALRTGIVARAYRKEFDLKIVKNDNRFLVVLEDPRDLGNVGAVVRAGAARGVAGIVVISSKLNPWHVNAIRGSAGLHFVQPVFSYDSLNGLLKDFSDREFIVASDEGFSIYDVSLDEKSILLFGSERSGVKETTKLRADKIVSLPMQEGVSSMNLATSVSAFLYAKR